MIRPDPKSKLVAKLAFAGQKFLGEVRELTCGIIKWQLGECEIDLLLFSTLLSIILSVVRAFGTLVQSVIPRGCLDTAES